ncbi:caltrin-like protein 1 isoform X2 [Octodon degus]|uniref:Caltrin-like protein 1 isoform X2 n=1 Tax=Octodon degus TaxID=10160 RepID=A0A6P6EFQ1_OCTDE|nr:caltrin-like protein 1 isoform X2 [Octodon degus]
MPFLKSWIKIIFITAVAFFIFSETVFAQVEMGSDEPDCSRYAGRLHQCNRRMYPICGSDGRDYGNTCVFCSYMLAGPRSE